MPGSSRKTRDRQLAKLAQRRAAIRRRKQRRRATAAFVGIAVAVIGMGYGLLALTRHDKTKTSATPTPSVSVTPSEAPPEVACGGTVPQAASAKKLTYKKPPDMTIDPTKTYTATIQTSCGKIVVDLFAKDAPLTVNNFVFLVNKHFYDGLTFHRIIKDFVIQGGDPQGDGSGGPGYQFDDELNNGHKYELGTLAMANSGANTNGSQFFIVAGPQGESLPNQYTIFGKVKEGLDVVSTIDAIPTASGDAPLSAVYIVRISIKES
jgi:cyclophilin family peptidyl-prolyl cis-trans isomerase